MGSEASRAGHRQTARLLLVWAASLLVAWAAALVAVTLVRSIGLIVPDRLAWLAALAAGVLVATPAAAWSSTLLRRDGSRARLGAVALVVGLAAVLLIVPVSTEVTAAESPGRDSPPPVVLAAQSALVLAAAAATASQLLRHAGGGRDVRLTVSMLLAARLVGPFAVLYAALTGQAGS